MDVRLIFRQLHMIPEVSSEEILTSRYVEHALRQAGYIPHRIGNTGVYADLVQDERLPWILLRADIDALPIQERSNASCPSTHDGVMHACGHDAHCAMLLAAAARLRTRPLPQNVRFLFQPAEETTKGAAEMIARGAIPPQMVACFAVHVWPGAPFGTVATKAGALMASSDVFRIEINGRSVHCAQRQRGADALQTAVCIASALSAIEQTAGDDTILFCGSIHSGSSHNVVPDEASLYGTLRTYSPAVRRDIKKQIERTVSEAATAHSTTATVRWEGGCPAVHNSDALIRRLQALEPLLTDDAIPTMAAEDFACYLENADGVMLWLGLGDTPPLHNESFYVPEDILPRGVALWEKIATNDWKGDADNATT